MVTLTILACAWVNDQLFCAQRVKHKISFRESNVIALTTQEYKFVPDLSMDSLAHAVTDRWTNETMTGCKIDVKGVDKSIDYEFPCENVTKLFKGCN